MTRIAAERLRVTYGAREVLHGVDLDVPHGAIHAILGPSGCGKTTLLRALAGLVPVAHGRVMVDGRDVTAVPPERRGVVLVPQESALFPHLDVGGNVAFGLRDRRSTRARTRVAELLRLVGLDGFAPRRVDHLSGGERQRVALARALAVDPVVLLLDEPLGHLDAPLRASLRSDLRRILRDAGATALHVTHDREEAFALADGLVLLDAGLVVDAGTPQRVHDAPSTPHAARLLGHRNLVPYALEGRRARTRWGTWELGTAATASARGVVLLPATALRAVPSDNDAGPVVETIDYLGGSYLVELRLGAERLWTQQHDARPLQVGRWASVEALSSPTHSWALPLPTTREEAF